MSWKKSITPLSLLNKDCQKRKSVENFVSDTLKTRKMETLGDGRALKTEKNLKGFRDSSEPAISKPYPEHKPLTPFKL